MSHETAWAKAYVGSVTAETHRQWCIMRARAALARGEVGNCLAQLHADLMRHASTKHISIEDVPVTKEGAEAFIASL